MSLGTPDKDVEYTVPTLSIRRRYDSLPHPTADDITGSAALMLLCVGWSLRIRRGYRNDHPQATRADGVLSIRAFW